MAAECLGAQFYRYNISNIVSIKPKVNDVVWVNRRYSPTDLRSTTPVQRWKFIAHPVAENGNSIPKAWKRPIETPSKLYSRDQEETRFLPYCHAIRCEEWSTLRQILPSQGFINKIASPRWGTGPAQKNMKNSQVAPSRFPHINSPMTRYVDDMHVNHSTFTLH